MQVGEKITLDDLRKKHYFDIHALAEKAGVDTSIIHRIMQHQYVWSYQAELVLAALNEELEPDEEYTLETLDIMLYPEEGEKEL